MSINMLKKQERSEAKKRVATAQPFMTRLTKTVGTTATPEGPATPVCHQLIQGEGKLNLANIY